MRNGVWEKACTGGTTCVEVMWLTASGGGNCVEVGFPDNGSVLVRDSKDPDGPVLTFTHDEWATFAAGIRAGVFDA